MALPKEPRQKMINMMYLVLTALLALNVSSEILNAFKTVNTSILNASRVIDDKNATTYKSFEQKLKDAKHTGKNSHWWPKAQKAKQLSEEMSKYIDDVKLELKSSLKARTWVQLRKSSAKITWMPPRDTWWRAAGKELQKRLENYRTQMLAVVRK
jgi:gliding motility-associated protein GldM